jgi:hypothetical protein
LKKSKILILGTASIFMVIFLLLVLYVEGFPPFAASVTVSQIRSNPQSWVGKRVRVQGTLHTFIAFIPEIIPPYNCGIVDLNGSASIGLIGRNINRDLDSKNVTVVGTVGTRRTGGLMGGSAVYLIEVETVRPL